MIAAVVVLTIILGLTGLAGWRRRGRSSGDLLGDQRQDLTESVLHQRSRGDSGGF